MLFNDSPSVLITLNKNKKRYRNGKGNYLSPSKARVALKTFFCSFLHHKTGANRPLGRGYFVLGSQLVFLMVGESIHAFEGAELLERVELFAKKQLVLNKCNSCLQGN